MATTYRSKVRITSQALRRAAYAKIRDLCDHCEALNTDINLIRREADNSITVELSNAISEDQADHLGLNAV